MDRVEREEILKRAEKMFGKARRLPAWKLAEMRRGYLGFRLAEVYKRNDNTDWFDVFEKIKLRYSGKLTDREWAAYCLDQGIACTVINGKDGIGGYFDLDLRTIVIQITPDILDKIIKAKPADLRATSLDFWVSFCHEDTHRQQYLKAGEHYNRKNYKKPTSQYWNDVIPDEDFKYYNQSIEADAYGREIGARLKLYYFNKSVSDIFELIAKNEIEEDTSRRIINVYKDPRIAQKAARSFFRALYDYLADNEELNDSFEDDYDDYSDIIF